MAGTVGGTLTFRLRVLPPSCFARSSGNAPRAGETCSTAFWRRAPATSVREGRSEAAREAAEAAATKAALGVQREIVRPEAVEAPSAIQWKRCRATSPQEATRGHAASWSSKRTRASDSRRVSVFLLSTAASEPTGVTASADLAAHSLRLLLFCFIWKRSAERNWNFESDFSEN